MEIKRIQKDKSKKKSKAKQNDKNIFGPCWARPQAEISGPEKNKEPLFELTDKMLGK